MESDVAAVLDGFFDSEGVEIDPDHGEATRESCQLGCDLADETQTENDDRFSQLDLGDPDAVEGDGAHDRKRRLSWVHGSWYTVVARAKDGVTCVVPLPRDEVACLDSLYIGPDLERPSNAAISRHARKHRLASGFAAVNPVVDFGPDRDRRVEIFDKEPVRWDRARVI